MTEDTKTAASSPLLTGVLMLIVGFGITLSGGTDSAVYNASAFLFNMTMKAGGSAMVLVAVLYWGKVRVAWLFDAVCTLTIGVLLFGVATVWCVYGYWVTGLVLIVFGVMSIGSARRVWAYSKVGVSHPSPETKHEAPATVVKDEVRAGEEAPAVDVHQVQRPAPEEPPPEGFLAELGRGDDAPS